MKIIPYFRKIYSLKQTNKKTSGVFWTDTVKTSQYINKIEIFYRDP
jgi:hypothetical protein